MSNMKKTILSLLFVFFTVTLGCIPLIIYGALEGGYGSDLHFHLKWSHYFAEQVFQGEIYPRWLMDMNGGAGSPTFFYYGPVPYYFSTLATALCGECSLPVKLGVGQYFTMLAAAISFFIFARHYAKHTTAALGAILYSYAPYHFGMDLLYRQAFSEVTAFVWIPLVFAAIDRMVAGKRAEHWLALVYALLVMTHLPSALLGSPCFLIYALVQGWFQKQWQLVIRFALSISVGILISGCYLIPAVTTQDYILAEYWWTPYFNYFKWFFLDWTVSPNPEIEGLLFQIAAVGTLFFVLSWPIAIAMGSKSLRPMLVTLLIIFLGSWFLMTPLSTFVWEMLPLLRKVQFPWRVLVMHEFAVVTTVVIALAVSLEKKEKTSIGIASGVFLAMAIWASYMTGVCYDSHRAVWNDSDHLERVEARIKIAAGATSHLPASVNPRSGFIQRMSKQQVVWDEQQGDVRVDQWQPRDIVLDMNLQEETLVIVRQIYYPGWEVTDVSTGSDLLITPHRQFGLIQFPARPGQYQVRIQLRALWQEQLGWISTGIGLLIIVFWETRNRARERKLSNDHRTSS